MSSEDEKSGGLLVTQKRVSFFLSIVAVATLFYHGVSWMKDKDANDDLFFQSEKDRKEKSEKQDQQISSLVTSISGLNLQVADLVATLRERKVGMLPFPTIGADPSRIANKN
jgi:hypothetical protein